MTETKEQALQGVDKMIESSEKSLARYNEGYKEGYSDGYDKALENVQGIIRKYNLGGGKELKPATKFVGQLSLAEQIAKIHSEYLEVMSAVFHNEGKERIAEELADVQQACETALAILGLTEDERREARRKVIAKNSKREYYAPERDKYGD